MALLQLQNSKQQCFVSEKDAAYLNHWSWSLNGKYVSRGQRRLGVYHKILLHRVIARRMGFSLQGNVEIDHRDRNPLNNRRSNLRVVTKSVNQHNSKIRTDSSTGIRGVHRRPNRKSYVVRIQVNKKRRYIGDFPTLKAAKRARKIAEQEYGYAS